MSPRAACRLEQIGFEKVYDYTLGKADWKAAGLAMVGDAPSVTRVLDATRTDVPTCNRDELIGDVHQRTLDADWDECVVVGCGNVVVGRLRNDAWKAEPATRADDVMESGPTTVRPDGLLHPLVERMAQRDTKLVLVATAQGQLVGALLLAEAELVSGEKPEQIWTDCEGCGGQWTVLPFQASD